MSDKKWCLRFKRTDGGARRCARYGDTNAKRTPRTCTKYTKTRAGKRCAKFREE